MKKHVTKTNIIIALLVLAIASTIYYYSSKAKKEERAIKIAEINKAIAEGTGENGNDADSLLLGTEPDPNYNPQIDGDKLISAFGGWTSTDDADLVLQTLGGKTKAQLVSISNYLASFHGMTLKQYIDDIFGDLGDSTNKQRALTIIQTAS